jgi:hypothetical protein
MNYLDLLPYDVLKLINRKVKEDYITKRRLERKENRRRHSLDEKKKCFPCENLTSIQ